MDVSNTYYRVTSLNCVAGALVAVAVNRDDVDGVSEGEDYILKVGSLTRGTNEWLVNVPDEAERFALGEDPEDSYTFEWVFVEAVSQCQPVPASLHEPAEPPVAPPPAAHFSMVPMDDIPAGYHRLDFDPALFVVGT